MSIDPKAIAQTLTDAGKVSDFIASLMKAVEASGDPSLKVAFLEAVMSATGGPADPEAAAAESLNLLRRFGKVGRWAAESLDKFRAAEQRHADKEWAEKLIAAEGLAATQKTDLLVELVAESRGNEERARRIIADRKTTAGAKVIPAPKTTDKRAAGTLADLIDAAAEGKL